MSLLFLAPRNYVTPIVTPEAGFDPYWSNVSLLMHMDGLDNGVVFLEEKGKTITKGGTVVTNSVNKKFGISSSVFNNGSLGAPASTDFLFTGDFTIEGWIRFDGITGGVQCLYGQKNATNYYFYIGWYGSNNQWICALNGQSNLAFNSAPPVAGQWYHIAFVRSNGAIKLYVDGVGSNSISNSSTLGYSDAAAYVGCTFPSQNILVGYIDDIRVTKDVARYTADFAVPTEALRDARGLDYYWDNTVLAMNCDDLTDLRGKTVTNYGLTVNTTDKVTGSGSLTSLATTYARIPYSSDFSFEADFTIEAWVYPTQTTVPNDDGWGRQCILSCGKAYSSSMWHLEWSGYAAASKFSVRWVNGPATESVGVTSTNTYALNTWHHVAVCRKGTTVYLFVNGQLAGSVVSAQPFTITGSGQTFNIGRTDYGSVTRDFVGHVDGVRITKGIARYTSGFLPSQDSFALPLIDPYWTQVVLAMHMDGADQSTAFIDAKGTSITLSGTPKMVTSLKKYGTASAYFNGSSRLILQSKPELNNFGTGDFTIECWVYLTGSGDQVIMGCLNSWPGIVAYYLEVRSGGDLRFFAGNGLPISLASGAGGVPSNVWNHLAVSRASGVTKMFVNGTQVGVSHTGTVTISLVSVVGIGQDPVYGNNGCNGNIDDLRITKGVARYTSNFIPPQVAFNHGS